MRPNRQRRSQAIQKTTPLLARNILVVQPFGLGDAIVTTQLIQALASMPHYIVYVAASKRRSGWETLKSCPGVAGIFDLNAVTRIRDTNCQMVVVCTGNGYMAARYGIRNVKTVLPDTRGRCETGKAKWTKHNLDYILDAARGLGYKGAKLPPPHVVVSPSVQLELPSGPKMVLGIGYYKPTEDARQEGWNRKQWGARHKHWGDGKFAALAREFRKLGGTSFLVGDGKDQLADGRDIVKASEGATVSLCGKLSLGGIAAVIQQCDLYVGNDTALTQVAQAFGLATMTIFKVANLVVRWKPRNEHGAYVLEQKRGNHYMDVLQWVRAKVARKMGR